MFIAISGTPGTGKTAIARILSRNIKAKLITTGYLTKKYKIKTSWDKKRKTKIIDAKKLAAAAEREAKKYKISIFEGHLSHLAPADMTIILRTSPPELEKRLKRKNWRNSKIMENVEAEALGIISHACRKKKHTIEIDTTGKKPEKTAALIIRLLNNYHLQRKYSPGKTDWSEAYAVYLSR